MIDTRDLRLIKAINDHGSLVRAARVLGMAQPNLTRNLAVLERKLKGRLFERSRQGVIATNLGRALLAEGGAILDSLERLNRHLDGVRGQQLQDLPIIAGYHSAESFCLTAIAQMMRQFPELRLHLTAANWLEVPRAILDREATIGVGEIRDLALDPSLSVEKLDALPLVIVGRPDHPLAGRDAVSLADIMAFPFLFSGRMPREIGLPVAQAREAARLAGNLYPAFPALTFERPAALRQLLQHGDALTGLPLCMAIEPMERGEIAILRWNEPWFALQPGIFTLRARALGTMEQHFLDLLRQANRDAVAKARAWCATHGFAPDWG